MTARPSDFAASRTVPCDDIIAPAASGRARGYRVVLAVVSAPPAYRPQVAATGEEPWRYFSKAGLLIHAGRGQLITATVPNAWRSRLAINWGSNTNTVYSSLHIPRCPRLQPSKNWNAYAGGFYLRSRSACVH
ncbi:MAG: hypothetical protein M3322_10765 [Actinomycetota bacterium]|nr:hypothetical protein [Actinomycetota bacterium]